jgi:hypothetical protein
LSGNTPELSPQIPVPVPSPFSTLLCIWHYLPSIFLFRYFDQAVLSFMHKFQQNGLLDNVNLSFAKSFPKDIIHPVLCNILPLINGIVSIEVMNSAQLVDFYDAGNSKDIYEMNMKMMEKARILGAR